MIEQCPGHEEPGGEEHDHEPIRPLRAVFTTTGNRGNTAVPVTMGASLQADVLVHSAMRANLGWADETIMPLTMRST